MLYSLPINVSVPSIEALNISSVEVLELIVAYAQKEEGEKKRKILGRNHADAFKNYIDLFAISKMIDMASCGGQPSFRAGHHSSRPVK